MCGRDFFETFLDIFLSRPIILFHFISHCGSLVRAGFLEQLLYINVTGTAL